MSELPQVVYATLEGGKVYNFPHKCSGVHNDDTLFTKTTVLGQCYYVLISCDFAFLSQNILSPDRASRLATTKAVVRGPVYVRKVLVTEWSAKTTPFAAPAMRRGPV